MKEVVISKSWDYFLNVKMVLELLKRKNIEVKVYESRFNKERGLVLSEIELSPKVLNDYKLARYVFLKKEEGIPTTRISIHDLIKDREDKDLIEICKQSKNIKFKIIEIPDEVKYEIIKNDCSSGESIKEISREWS